MGNDGSHLLLEEVAESAEMKLQREQFDRNLAWLQAHASDVYSKHRGKCICVAGQELFVADTAREALAQAAAAHADDRALRPLHCQGTSALDLCRKSSMTSRARHRRRWGFNPGPANSRDAVSRGQRPRPRRGSQRPGK